MTDLEQLSRDAAKVLPEMLHRALKNPDRLAYDTEACAEIMVRVLWRLGISLEQTTGREGEHYVEASAGTARVAIHGDPVQAFRTVVLRALIEVKK
ncbi:hypothetical protein UFOVP1326_27 [uncultured Caudovirales phage]|uniref:Uncharacterized protein n=1 Tax=uncultured Caudovirales phage TaxID=2100421 RepID=A0A6J5RZC5_9CAUD|nr:hypothetical protein UFOVP1326_27 [uncultured Caudovirales phage]CAB4212452.1 hypothetical protein UFOVP1436_12 [uncultured Caudovirales phage]